MEWYKFENLEESEKKKSYESLLNQLNELKNKYEIVKMEKNNLEEENKKLFEINVNSIPGEKKLEIDEKISNMSEELYKQKDFLENIQKTLDEKDREKNKIEKTLTEEISRFNFYLSLFD